MSEKIYKYLEINDLKDMLNKSGEKYGEKIAYKIKIEKDKYKTYTHKEIRQMINYLGTRLIDLGLQNKRIAIIGENRYEWEIAYLSVACGTGIVVPLDKSLPQNELEKLIERSEIEAIFYSEKYNDMLKNIVSRGIGKLKTLISMDLKNHLDGIYSQKELIDEGQILVEGGDERFIKAKIDNEKMSVMLFTSGTTSDSKIVAISHKNLVSNLMDIASVLDINSDDVFLSFLPLHHVFECTVGFLFSLYVGAETVFCDGIRYIVENLNEYKVSVMASVPAIYERIFKMIRREIAKKDNLEEILENEKKYQNSSMEEKKEVFKSIHDMLGGNIKLLISGAASLDKEIEQKYRNLGLNLVQGYGLTETSPVIGIGTKKYHKVGSIGKTVPSVEAKVIDCNKEGIGELIVRGPNIMLGYYQNEDATKKAIIDGWFYTGDLARIDEDGYIFICGRKKNVIVLKNGKNIYPEEMENLINKIEGVEESFVYGKQMSNDKENIKVYAKIVYDEEVVNNAYKVQSEKEIHDEIAKKIREINSLMPKYKAIRGFSLTKEPLIKTTTNKLKRKQNLDKILEEEKENA